jgi:hypothetical protein
MAHEDTVLAWFVGAMGVGVSMLALVGLMVQGVGMLEEVKEGKGVVMASFVSGSFWLHSFLSFVRIYSGFEGACPFFFFGFHSLWLEWEK